MRLSSLLLVGLTALVVCCGVVLPSKDVYSKTASSDLVNPAEFSSIDRKGGRLLRSTESVDANRGESEVEDRQGIIEKLGNLLWKVCKGKAECVEELARTPKLHRSDSAPLVPSEKKLALLLKRPNLVVKRLHDKQKLEKGSLKFLTRVDDELDASLKQLFPIMVQQGKNPDDVVAMYKLQPNFQPSKLNEKNALDVAIKSAGASSDEAGFYHLFYRYYLYYKQVNPSWTSKFEQAVGA